MLLKLARERQAVTITGVEMFLRQAALQFKLYTGQGRSAGHHERHPQTQAGAAARRMTLDANQEVAARAGMGWPWSGTGARANPPSARSWQIGCTGGFSMPTARSRRAGQPITSIFAIEGEPAFRDWEERTIRELVQAHPTP